MFQKFCYSVVSLHFSPNSLINLATFSDDPSFFHAQRFRLCEATLFLLKLRLRPLVIYCLNRAYKDSGYSALGFGYYTNALRTGDEVVKIYEFSVHCNDSERNALKHSLNRGLKLARQNLGKFIVPTEVGIEAHPVSGRPCVVLRQRYISGKLLAKRPYSAYLSAKQRKSLLSLLTKTRQLYADTNYLVDVNGRNLAVQNDDVVVLDTILMGPVDVVMLPQTLKILNNELELLSNGKL